ncbi:MAG TPA: queuosine precursor transporter [Anaerolineales bacterium]|nr:queuosine precursor transporter [Anaerolineales bacterium]
MPSRPYRHLDLITALFVTVLIVSNIASTKLIAFLGLPLDGGTILFPLSYIFGDILTEVYGYQRSRRVIWIGFACLAIMAVTFAVVDLLPPDPAFDAQAAFSRILGQTPRIVLGSLIAYWAGEFVNSYALAKIKIKMDGRRLWIRTIASTLIGQLVDTAVFLPIAFFGVFPNEVLVSLFVANYIFKVGTEAIFTPITYQIVAVLKRAESEDYYDRNTDFNPFAIK